MRRQTETVTGIGGQGRVLFGKPKDFAVGQTFATLSVVTPGLMMAIEASIHSRALT